MKNISNNPPSFSILVVDESRCQGHGRCNLIAPEIFSSDEFGKAVPRITKIDAALSAQVLLAVANCPEYAISLNDGKVDEK